MLTSIIGGELRQGALAGLVTASVAAAAEVPVVGGASGGDADRLAPGRRPDRARREGRQRSIGSG